MKCFYHSADLDGHCSGAIVKYLHPECELFSINYGQDFPWDKIVLDEVVFMVDFTLQPFAQMERLVQVCQLVWIEHHKTAIKEAFDAGFASDGLQEIGVGACLLTWRYLSRQPIPNAVRLLAEYAVWNHTNPSVLPFQYGFKMNSSTSPDNTALWAAAFEYSDSDIEKIVERGQIIIHYEEQQNAKFFCTTYAFETELSILLSDPSVVQKECDVTILKGKIKFTAICANSGFTNSKLFDSMYNPARHDLMITFCRLKLPKKKWTVSLYSTKEDIDCSAIARLFGGGGHKGAAGFQCNQLPFEY
jgi:oligoribonuclease NrnB/cAMP/cGMP phosphodiesterase (DHH superfamily)